MAKQYPYMVHFTKWDGKRGPEYAHEKMDCTVRALAKVLDITYMDAHRMLAEAGRQDRKPFLFVPYMFGFPTWQLLHGYRVVTVQKELSFADSFDGGMVRRFARYATVGAFVKCMLPGRYIVRTPGHVFPVIDGEAFDTWFRPRARIKNIWRFDPQTLDYTRVMK